MGGALFDWWHETYLNLKNNSCCTHLKNVSEIFSEFIRSDTSSYDFVSGSGRVKVQTLGGRCAEAVHHTCPSIDRLFLIIVSD